MQGLRRGRACAAGSALLVTLVALLGAVGLLPTGTPAAAASEHIGRVAGSHTAALSSMAVRVDEPPPAPPTALPANTGSGRRIVFDISDQRVWLVDGTVRSTYLVSGSLTDNLQPGRYEVYSRSRWAVGVDDSGVMEYFVRFAHGAHAAIGFHSIPTKHGRPLQTVAQLGSPQSHGCIRQAKPDAQRLWTFAPVGTKVVVTA